MCPPPPQSCQHNTEGPQCDKCRPGYFGDPSRGRHDDCKPCPCPYTETSRRYDATTHAHRTCVCVCIHAYTHTHTHAHINTQMHTRTHAHNQKHILICMSTHVFVCVCVCVCVFICNSPALISLRNRAFIHSVSLSIKTLPSAFICTGVCVVDSLTPASWIPTCRRPATPASPATQGDAVRSKREWMSRDGRINVVCVNVNIDKAHVECCRFSLP